MALVGALAWSQGVFDPARSNSPPQSGRPADWPSPGVGAADEPIGTPPVVETPNSSFRFMMSQPNSEDPVAYDPCRPIDVVMRPTGAPPGAQQLVTDALARLSQATGLQVNYIGESDEAPDPNRTPFQPDRYGDRWAPVLIAWVTPDEDPDFAADLGGQAGSYPVGYDDTSAYVTGMVELDAEVYAQLATTPEGGADARAILLHELGHLVGLAHVNDPTQLMYPKSSGVYDYGPGDLTGLAQLGGGRCLPEL